MSQAKYDKTSVDSIVRYADLLTGKSLNEVITIPIHSENVSNKGELGRLVETTFFEISPSNKTIDFPDAGLELKVTGLRLTRDGGYAAKERLVIGMIDFSKIVDEDWATSSLYIKCRLMLLLFYLYQQGVPRVSQKFVLPPLLYKIFEWEEDQLRRDWEVIRTKVRAGRAHELSEGDTIYLGACRKGAGGDSEKLVAQPFAELNAKARAFSFKPAYLNRIVSKHQALSVDESLDPKLGFEASILKRFEPFIGLSVSDISAKLQFSKSSKNHKGFLGDLARRMLGTTQRRLPEFEGNGIEMKTVRIEVDGKPKEHMSFPHFNFLEIQSQDWEESDFFEKVEKKFLFVIFARDTSGELHFKGVRFWNMPYEDRLEAARVWEGTQRVIRSSGTNFPKAGESNVAHVRPKGRNAQDRLPLPNGQLFTKQCFWLNRDYVAKIIRDAL